MYIVIVLTLIMCSLMNVIILVLRQGLKLIIRRRTATRKNINRGNVTTSPRLDDAAKESIAILVPEQEASDATATARNICEFYAYTSACQCICSVQL